MGPGIVIPVMVIAVVVPIVLWWAKKNFKDAPTATADDTITAGSRLTSNSLRELPSPRWRVVYEIADSKLGGVEHVLIGPPGVYAVLTSMTALPSPPTEPPDAAAVARAAIRRGPLDDALRRCAMDTDRILDVHWGPPVEGAPDSVELVPGLTAVDGRSIVAWATSQPERLTAAQIDLAWQTVTTAIGRPDPLRSP